jgi:vacuolar-type H+-ATPase subunit H
MARQQHQDNDDSVVAAIERVLEVERDGAQQLQRGEQQAEQLLDQARGEAAAIAERADARIARLYGSYLQKVQRDIDKLAQASLSSGKDRDRADGRLMLIDAVRRVAAKMTGGG